MWVWSPHQLRVFLDWVREDDLYAAWLLVTTTGMRRGELAGLRWIDVDLDAGRLSVRQPRVVVANVPQASEPKTARGPVRWPSIRSPWQRCASIGHASIRTGC